MATADVLSLVVNLSTQFSSEVNMTYLANKKSIDTDPMVVVSQIPQTWGIHRFTIN